MEFTLNHLKWKIILQNKDTLVKRYNEEFENKTTFAFGLTDYPNQQIIINKDMCLEEQIKTLKHELTHVYIWCNGMYYAQNFCEETLCEIVSCIVDFINEVVELFRINVEFKDAKEVPMNER